MNKTLNSKERQLVKELLNYAKNLSEDDLEHLVWIGEGMYHSSKTVKQHEVK